LGPLPLLDENAAVLQIYILDADMNQFADANRRVKQYDENVG
jgi:hypothetical protein